MKRPRHFTTAAAGVLAALLIASIAAPTVDAFACICPGGQVEVEATAICGCCTEEDAEPAADGSVPSWESASCDDCIDVMLRVPPVKKDSPQPQTSTGDTRGRATHDAGSGRPGMGRSTGSEHGHRLAMTLLASVVLLT